MYTLTQEQVNELAKGKSIQEVLPEAFKLEVGKWYKCPELGKAIFRVTDIQSSEFKAYGLNYRGEWTCEGNWIGTVYKPTQEATREEVEAMLIAEAKKRGFVEGVIYDSLPHNFFTTNPQTKVDYIQYNKEENCLYSDYGVIFDNGKWATIVPESKSKSDILTELIDYATTNDNLWLKNQLEKLR